jgi:hypothetical protein
MTPDEIEGLRLILDTYPEEERMIFARAAAEYLRLHDAIQRLYKMTPSDVQREAAFLDVRSGLLADTVEQIVRRFLE